MLNVNVRILVLLLSTVAFFTWYKLVLNGMIFLS